MAFDAGELVVTLRAAGLQALQGDVRQAKAALEGAAGSAAAAGAAAEAGAKRAARAVRDQAAETRGAGTQAQETGRKAKQAGDDAAAAAKRAADAATKQAAAIHTVGVGMGAFGTAATAAFAMAVHAQADFGNRMAQVQSLTHGNAQQMGAMREAALTMGAAYGQSANDVADAQIELTKAGQSLEDQLGGGLKGALALAASGQLDVGEATSIATTALTQFHLTADDTTHVADLLAAGADKALGSVGDLGMGLKQGGLVASQFGMSIDETTGILALFANNGLMGSDAGTSLKTMLLSLANPSDQAAAALKAAGVSAYDAQGHFVGMDSLAGQLADGMGNYSDSARQAALSTIFGTDAIRAAAILFDSGAEGTAKWTHGMESAGFAADQAAGKMDSLAGDTTKLGAALQNDLIRAGASVEPFMRLLAQGATGLANGLADVDPAALAVGTALTGVLGVTSAAAGGFLLLLPRIVETRAAMALLAAGEVPLLSAGVRGIVGATGSAVGGLKAMGSFLLGPWGIALAAGALAVSVWQKAIEDAKASADTLQAAASLGASGVDELVAAAARGQNVKQGPFAWMAGQDLDVEAGVLHDLTGQLQQMASMRVNPLDSFLNGTPQLAATEETLRTVGTQLGQLAATDGPAAAQAFEALAHKTDGSKGALTELLARMPDYADALEAQATKNGLLTGTESDAERATILLTQATKDAQIAGDSQADTAAAQAGAIADIQGSAASATQDVKTLADAIAGLGSTQLDERSATRDMEAAIDDATKAIRKNGKGLDDHTAAGRANNDALDAIVKTTTESAAAALRAGRSQEHVTGIVKEGRDAFIAAATAATGDATAAKKLADHLHLIPGDVKSLVHVTTTGLTGLADAKTYLQWLKDHGATHVGVSAVVAAGLAGGKNQATGGAVTGPGPIGVDSVPTMLAPGEHVLTTRDVSRLGGQGGVYAFRAALQSGGVRGYAAGGAIGGQIGSANNLATQYDHQADAERRALRQAQDRLKQAQRLEATRQRTWEDISGDKKHAAQKRSARHAHEAAQKALDAAEKAVQTHTTALQKAEDARARQQARAGSLQDTREDFATSRMRGDLTQGAQSAFTAVDQLRSLARSSDIGPATQRAANKAADRQNAAMVTLMGRYDEATKSVDAHEAALKADQDAAAQATSGLDTAKGALQSIRDAAAQMASQVASSVRGFFALGDSITAASETTQTITHGEGRGAWSETATVQRPASVTLASIQGNAAAGASAMEGFANDLQSLVAMGYAPSIVQDVANLGVANGGMVAKALLSAGAGDVAGLNQSYARQATAAASAGNTVSGQAFQQDVANGMAAVAAAQATADAATQTVALEQAQLDAANANVTATNAAIVAAQQSIVDAITRTFTGSGVAGMKDTTLAQLAPAAPKAAPKATTAKSGTTASGDHYDFRGATIGYDPKKIVATTTKAKTAANLKQSVRKKA